MASTLQVDTILNAAGTGPVNFSKGFKTSSGIKDIANAAYTILDSDGFDLICTDTLLTAGRTVTLPVPANNTGRTIVFKKTDSSTNALTIAVNTGTIDGASSNIVNSQYGQVTLRCDGTNWKVVNTSGDAVPANIHVNGPTTGTVSVSSGTLTQLATLSIPPGTWLINAQVIAASSANTVLLTTIAGGVSTNSAGTGFTGNDSSYLAVPVSLTTGLASNQATFSPRGPITARPVTLTAATTYNLHGHTSWTGTGTVSMTGYIYATRIG